MNRSARAVAIALSLATATAAGADDDGYRALFSKSQQTLSDADEREIFAQTGMTSSGSGGLAIEGCGDVDASVELVDLNGDGRAEVFVLFGNTCWSGMTGSNLLLFVRDATGHFRSNLGFPAPAYTPLSVGNGSLPRPAGIRSRILRRRLAVGRNRVSASLQSRHGSGRMRRRRPSVSRQFGAETARRAVTDRCESRPIPANRIVE